MKNGAWSLKKCEHGFCDIVRQILSGKLYDGREVFESATYLISSSENAARMKAGYIYKYGGNTTSIGKTIDILGDGGELLWISSEDVCPCAWLEDGCIKLQFSEDGIVIDPQNLRIYIMFERSLRQFDDLNDRLKDWVLMKDVHIFQTMKGLVDLAGRMIDVHASIFHTICRQAAHIYAGKDWHGLSFEEQQLIKHLQDLGYITTTIPVNGFVGQAV
jgi:hypothetical protein